MGSPRPASGPDERLPSSEESLRHRPPTRPRSSEHAEVSMLALHLLQSVLVHIDTLLLQAVLEVPQFHDGVGRDERRALTPLFWTHINSCGRFRLNMDTRLELGRILVPVPHPPQEFVSLC
nr:Tn3 family transposase [Amycolatopsis taiwanensis]